mgnify:CR=1 FL=1
MSALKTLIESRRFEMAITALIVINAITLGLETSQAAMASFGPVLIALDRIILSVFVLELLARFVVYRMDFFRDPWRIFDLLVVSIALFPATGNLSVLRALRPLDRLAGEVAARSPDNLAALPRGVSTEHWPSASCAASCPAHSSPPPCAHASWPRSSPKSHSTSRNSFPRAIDLVPHATSLTSSMLTSLVYDKCLS